MLDKKRKERHDNRGVKQNIESKWPESHQKRDEERKNPRRTKSLPGDFSSFRWWSEVLWTSLQEGTQIQNRNSYPKPNMRRTITVSTDVIMETTIGVTNDESIP